MNTIANPSALEIMDRVRAVVAPDDFVNEALNRKNELEQLQRYMERQSKKAAQSESQKAMEKMIIMAIQSNAHPTVIETMRVGAGMTETRLEELRKQV